MTSKSPQNKEVTRALLEKDARRRALRVRLRVVGQTDVYSTNSLKLDAGAQVLVPTDRGPEIGTILDSSNLSDSEAKELKSIQRPLSEKDQKKREETEKLEKQAFDFCKSEISESRIGMKLISTHITHDNSHATFYFTAGKRVDFRTLVKRLAQRLQMGIAMRQIGIRDAARHTGGTGICGGELCCSTWLPEFKPISIRMAKDQNLTLNNLKLSGVCGRLRCCLEYEHEIYKSARKELPKINKRVFTPKGEGRTRDINILKRTIRVQLTDGTIEEFPAKAVTTPPFEKKGQTPRLRSNKNLGTKSKGKGKSKSNAAPLATQEDGSHSLSHHHSTQPPNKAPPQEQISRKKPIKP